MADTAIRSDNALTVQKWSAALFKEAMKNVFFGRFVGKSEDSIIQTKTDLTKEEGDKITFGLRMMLDGQGRSDDQDLEGYEEALTFHNFSATVHLRANAVKAKGKMSLRRTRFEIMEEARSALSEWLTNTIDNDTVLALSGMANPAVKDDDDGVVAAMAPVAARRWVGGQTTAGVLSANLATDASLSTAANYLFGTCVISTIKRKAQLVRPKIRPVRVDGKDMYVMLIHPYQAKALKNEAAWLSAQRDANLRGADNPIFSGALGVWDGVVVHEYDRILTRLGDGVGTDPTTFFESGDPLPSGIYGARSLFLGAQAGVHAYAQYPGWYTKNFQYGRVPGVATDLIYNVAKTKFNSLDFGMIAVDTCIIPD
jgi:N4-gp56 family major capsid protein